MERTYIFLLLTIISFSSCSGNKEYTLTGKLHIDGFDGRTVYLSRMNDDLMTFTDIDSTKIVGDTFRFKGMSSDSIMGYHVFIGKEEIDRIVHSPLIFIPEKGDIKINLDDDYVGFPMGTPQNDRLGKLMQLTHRLEMRTRAVDDSLMVVNPEETRPPMPEDLLAFTHQVNDEVYLYLKGLKGTYFLDEMFIRYRFCMNMKRYDEIVELASERLIKYFEANDKKRRAHGKSVIGEPFLDLYAFDVNDKEVALSSYVRKSKVTLIDIWSSWCGACIQEIPVIRTAYDKYKNAGFEVVTVSLDSNKKNWEKALKEIPMEWPQLMSKNGRDGARFIYGIQSIPYTVLVDENGIVLAKNIRGHELDAELEKLLK